VEATRLLVARGCGPGPGHPQNATIRERLARLALTTSSPQTLADDGRARGLVQEREHELKRSRARLGNPRALERWSGAAGAQPLNYRWHRVRAIVADILKGLEG